MSSHEVPVLESACIIVISDTHENDLTFSTLIFQDDHAVGERLQLFCRQSGEVTAFPATPQDYLKLLMPPPDEELE